MLGNGIKNQMQDKLTIIGGGITGLTVAYIAAKNGAQVTILEKSNYFGGLLNTFPVGANYLEYYYHHFFTHDAELMWLLRELDLMDKLVYNNTSMGFFRHGEIYGFNTPVDLLAFKPLSIYSAIRFGITSLYLAKVARWEKYENVSALDWFYTWAGRSVTDTIWKPMLDIKFGPHSSKIPLSWMIGRLKQRLYSRKDGNEELAYLNGSLKVLLDSLISKLEKMDVSLVNNVNIDELIGDKNSLKKIRYNNKEIIGSPFIFTIPSTKMVGLFHSVNPEFSDKLAKVKYFGVICVILELNKKFTDIYWLNIADEGFPFGGIIEHTNFISKTEYDGKHIIYLSRYFDQSESIALMEKNELIKLMIEPLSKINSGFDKSWIDHIHVFKTDSAAVVCDLEFSNKVMNCKTPIENLYIANMAHVYPDERSVNNSIRIAANACKTIGYNTSSIPSGNSMAGLIGF